MDKDKVNSIIQYALLVASREDDFREQGLGSIHLVKYVYLADLAYASKNDGKTYTGTNWIFYKFGPWSQEVHEQIKPAVQIINATHSKTEGWDTDRWRYSEQGQSDEIEKKLLFLIKNSVATTVHSYTNQTYDLLHHVYETEPMLNAAPNEKLDFSHAVMPAENDPANEPALRMESLSKTKRKKFKVAMEALKKKRQEKRQTLEPEEEKWIKLEPLYPTDDGVYEQGLAWLDNIAGEKLPERKIIFEFSDEVWKSDARKGHKT